MPTALLTTPTTTASTVTPVFPSISSTGTDFHVSDGMVTDDLGGKFTGLRGGVSRDYLSGAERGIGCDTPV